VTGAPAEVLGLWLHSHEEDSGSTRVYRPASYDFPVSRGRTAVELRPDGTYIEYDSGPDDRGRAVVGRWQDVGDGRVEATVTRSDGSSSTRRISYRDDGMLAVE
jgi:hypothetical protein